MKNECNIVRDLLPLYIENMTSPESAQFVEAHLSKCPECNEIYFSMTATDEENITDEDAQRKILPLRLVKRMLWKKIVISIVASVLSIALLIGGGTLAYNIIDKQNKNAEIDYGESEFYLIEDRQAGIDLVISEFVNSLDFGYDVKSVRFAGDEECLDAWKEWNEDPDHVTQFEDYRDIMVIYLSMKTPVWTKSNAWQANIYYEDIKFVLMKNKDLGKYWRGWQMIWVSIPSPYPEATSASEVTSAAE